MSRLRSQVTIVAVAAATCSAVALFTARPAVGFDQYKDGCNFCHGDFTDEVSPKGSIFPQDNKHNMHRGNSFMNTDCSLCHTSGDEFSNPFIGSSDGTANNPGLGCTGCHQAEGLRLHHVINNVTECAGCHPGDPLPPPENVFPTYYGTVDTNANFPCNETAMANFGENWTIGDFEGLDNDGDNLYDTNDPDCQTGCVGDVDVDGNVGFTDLNIVLAQWGACPGCTGDLDDDDNVGFTDLNIVLGAWGPC